MKIAYFAGTMIEDGVTKVLLRLAQHAVKNGHEAIIITGYIKPEIKSPVKVITVPAVKFPLYKDYRLTTPGRLYFASILKEFQPDLLHLHSPDPLSWAALNYGRRHKIPVLITHHTAFDRYLPYYRLAWLEPLVWDLLGRLYNRASLVDVPSPLIASDLRQHGIKNLAVIPWGIDLQLFNPGKADAQWRNEVTGGKSQPIILYAGRLTREKDLKTLATVYQALRRLNDSTVVPDAKAFQMVVAGDGPARTELESLMPGAIFTGNLDHARLAEVYAASDIFLFPSSTDNFPLVIMEALASGLVPVVADRGGAPSAIIHQENGLICRACDASEFASQVQGLLDDPAALSRLKKAAYQSAQEYDWEKILVRIFKLYEDLVSRPPKPKKSRRR
jgi:glycosyltransferase involved in cell wall biosynthesis